MRSRDAVRHVHIDTPEGVRFSLPAAGPCSRMLALSLDLALVYSLQELLGITIIAAGIIGADAASGLHRIGLFLLPCVYGVFMEWKWKGRTIGKRLLGLRVMDARGLRLRFFQVLIRNLFRVVDFLPLFYLVGGGVCLLTRRFQRLGDLAAGTVVIRHEPFRAPDISRITGGKYNSFRQAPHLMARLRRHIRPEEAHIALEAVLRRDELDPADRLNLFKEIADGFRSRAVFSESRAGEMQEGMSDERFVRNMTDILFNTSKPHPARRIYP